MIYATVNLTIHERESVCDKIITLYRGDKNVQIRFVLKNNKFTVVNQTYAQLIINRPSASSLFTETALIENNTVILTISEDMIDELTEIGVYQFQIRLYDDNMDSRVTLPPCNSSLIIEKPIISDTGDVVNIARVNDALVQAQGGSLEIFDEEENYIKTHWKDGDLISDSRLNKIEDALYDINIKTKDNDNDKIDNIIEDFNSLSTKVNEINSDIEGINTNINIIDSEISNISANVNTSIEDINSKINGMSSEIKDTSDNMIRMNTEISSINTELEDMSMDIGNMNTNISEINTSIEDMNTEISNMNTEISNMNTEISNMNTEISNMNTEISNINANVNTSIEDINSNIDTILAIIDEPPTYTQPSFSLSASVYNIEHLVSTNITINPIFLQNDAGSVTSFVVKKSNGETIYNDNTVISCTDNISLSHGDSISYTATVTYSDGAIKNTLLGIPYPQTSIKQGSIQKNVTIKGYALSYYGVISNSTFENTNGLSKKLRTRKGDTLTFNLTNQRVIYMYPKSFGTLTSIKDANNFDYINSYTLSTETFNNVEYYVYILTDAVTISNFKQIFS